MSALAKLVESVVEQSCSPHGSQGAEKVGGRDQGPSISFKGIHPNDLTSSQYAPLLKDPRPPSSDQVFNIVEPLEDTPDVNYSRELLLVQSFSFTR